jgi:hypothetical protein
MSIALLRRISIVTHAYSVLAIKFSILNEHETARTCPAAFNGMRRRLLNSRIGEKFYHLLQNHCARPPHPKRMGYASGRAL